MEFEKSLCCVCGSTEYEPVRLHGRPLETGQFGYPVHPVLCRCGFVYLNPRWTKQRLDEFYAENYNDLYRLETKPDYGIEGVRRHGAEIWDRLTKSLDPVRIRSIRNVLDVGCGSGYGLKLIQERLGDAAIFGIEATPECRKTLEGPDVGAKLIASDLDSDWPVNYRARFDLIVMRHVLEHMISPVETLSKLRAVLSATGILYIAVPDMMHPRTVLRDYDKWWEYWFRAVHLVYCCKDTLFAILEKAGLYPLASGEEKEEVWCLVCADRAHCAPYETNVYEKQKQVLWRFLP